MCVCVCEIIRSARAAYVLSHSAANTHTHTDAHAGALPLSHTHAHTHTESAAPTNWTKSRLLAPTEALASALSLSLSAPTAYALSAPQPLLSLFLSAVLLPLHSSACEVNELQRLCQCLFNERRQRTWQRLWLWQRQRQRSRVDPSWMSLKWRSLCKYWRGKELEERRRIAEGGTHCMFA